MRYTVIKEVSFMSSKEIAFGILDSLTDEQIEAFITLFASDSVKARMETEQIVNDPDRRRFNSFSEIEKEIFADDVSA